MTLNILLGDYGAGKTATAKYLAKQNGGEYIDVDLFSQPLVKLDILRTWSSGKNYYLDGHPTGHNYGTLTKETLGLDVKYIVCMAAPNIVQQRQRKKKSCVNTILPRSMDEIKSITHLAASIALSYDDDPIFVDTTDRPITLWNKTKWFTRWLEIGIYAALKDAGEYQDVELSDRKVVGLSESYKTWQRLEKLIDFKGRSVIDYGCNYGYFCFKAEEAGATQITGIDESRSVLDMATSIGITKKSKACFINIELTKFKPPETNIIMALNVLHHLGYDENVLARMFRAAGTIVLEMPFIDYARVDTIARINDFITPVIVSSHREDRCIVVYSKHKPIVVPKEYIYRPRRFAISKAMKRGLKKIIPGWLINIGRKIKRKLR
jgi:SAM-dependent methyltransferase